MNLLGAARLLSQSGGGGVAEGGPASFSELDVTDAIRSATVETTGVANFGGRVIVGPIPNELLWDYITMAVGQATDAGTDGGLVAIGGSNALSFFGLGDETESEKAGMYLINSTNVLSIENHVGPYTRVAGVQFRGSGAEAGIRPASTNVNICGTADARWSGVFGIAGDFSQSLTLPAYATAARPAASTAGRVIFNTTTSRPNYDTGSGWVHSDGTAA